MAPTANRSTDKRKQADD